MAELNLDDEAFKVLSQATKVKEEENRINQGILTNLKLSNRLNNEVVQRYAYLGEAVAGLITEVQLQRDTVNELIEAVKHSHDVSVEIRALTSVLREIAEELSKRMDRFESVISQRIGTLEDIELAELAGQQLSPKRRGKVIKDLKHEQRQRELQQHYMNLADLRLVAAKHGGINVPLDVINGMRYAEEAIAALEAGTDE